MRDLFFIPDTKVFEVDRVHMKKQIGGWPCGYIDAWHHLRSEQKTLQSVVTTSKNPNWGLI